MFDDTMDPNDAGLLELTRRLEAYADRRLTPSVAATVNMRTSVMNAAHRRAAVIVADVAGDAAAATLKAQRAEQAGSRRSRMYRPAAALMAASLAVAMLAGTVYGAKAGGPTYSARLWIEAANLPAGLVARAQAETVRLDRRIAEVEEASSDGDAPATEAALSAYSVIVAEAVKGAAGDPSANATIEISVTHHVVVLTQLAGTVPAQARGAIAAALVSSSKVIRDLDGQSTRGNAGQPSGPDTRGGGSQSDPKGSPRPEQAGQGLPVSRDDPKVTTVDPAKHAPHPRDHGAPPRGRSRGSAADDPARPVRPSSEPKNADHQSVDPGQAGEPSAP